MKNDITPEDVLKNEEKDAIKIFGCCFILVFFAYGFCYIISIFNGN
jgi:hypothetical protein